MRVVTRAFLALILILGASVFCSQNASAQLISPYGRNFEGKPLSPEELKLVETAIRDALEQYRVGAVSDWKSANGERSGRAEVTELFKKDGMRCAKVTHQYTKGPGNTFSAPICQVPDGSWKLAY